MNTLLSLLFTTKFSYALQFQNYIKWFSTFSMNAVKAKCKIWRRKQAKTLLIQLQWFIFCKPACLQKYFHRQALSILGLSSDGHYRLMNGSFLSMQRLLATDGNRKCAVFVFNLSSHYHINCLFSLVDTISLKIWERPLSTSVHFRLPSVAQKCCMLKLPNVSPGHVITIASRDQFKPIRIGENLLVNYNDL